MKATIVIPTCRDISFLEEWKETDLINQHLIVVEDKKEITGVPPEGWDIERYSHKEIDDELKDKAWIIPNGDGGIRSFGIYKAFQYGYTNPNAFTICLDDDVYPLNSTSKFVQQHQEILMSETKTGPWFNQIQNSDVFPRGFPVNPKWRKNRRIVLNMGLWKDNPDLSAFEYFKEGYDETKEIKFTAGTIPYGQFFCLSSMNVAFDNIMTPAMYHMWTGTASGVYRYDDVWAGMFSKKIADHLGFAMTMGDPTVVHRRKSDPKKSLQKEIYGMTLHERFWASIDNAILEGDNVLDCYLELADQTEFFGVTNHINFFKKLGKAMETWARLF